MAHQSNRNVKTRVSRLSRRVDKSDRDLHHLAIEIGQILQQHQKQTLTNLGLLDLLVTVLERDKPGLAESIRDLAKERTEAAKAKAESATDAAKT